MDTAKFTIMQKIDDPKRYMGLTIDELVPILLCTFLGWNTLGPLYGFSAATLAWIGIRYLKKGRGLGWLIGLLYWHLPTSILKGVLFKKTPDASNRHWLY